MPLLTGPIVAQPQADPLEAYLKEKGAGQDELANYLHDRQVQARAKGVTPSGAFGAGAAQGATLGFGDEIQGAVQAAGQKVLPEKFGGIDYGKTFGQLYKESRDTKRLENEAARTAYPKTYTAGEVVGGAAPAVLTPGGRLAALATGAAQGAGFSDADTVRGLAGDSALGGLYGFAGHEVGSALSSAGTRLAALARGKAGQALGNAANQASGEVAAATGSLKGTYGGLRQTENNAILSLLKYEAEGHLDPPALARLQTLKQSGRVREAINEAAGNNLDFLETRVPEVAAAKKAYLDALQNEPQAIQARTAELSKPQIGADVASLAKSYAEPVIAAAIAPPGMKEAAGLIFGRTRAGKALMSRVNRPGNQIALWNAVEGAANAPNTTAGEFLRRALAGTATQQAVQAQ